MALSPSLRPRPSVQAGVPTTYLHSLPTRAAPADKIERNGRGNEGGERKLGQCSACRSLLAQRSSLWTKSPSRSSAHWFGGGLDTDQVRLIPPPKSVCQPDACHLMTVITNHRQRPGQRQIFKADSLTRTKCVPICLPITCLGSADPPAAASAPSSFFLSASSVPSASCIYA